MCACVFPYIKVFLALISNRIYINRYTHLNKKLWEPQNFECQKLLRTKCLQSAKLIFFPQKSHKIDAIKYDLQWQNWF